MRKSAGAVLFLGKARDWHTARAADFCRRNFESVSVFLGEWGDPFPPVANGEWTLIISYLSRWILPGEMLRAARYAINFHPGPPEYPGYGCNNFAIYEGAARFGVTCHHMAPAVDTGPIIQVERFQVLPTDTGGTLLLRTYDFQLTLFYRIAGCVIRGEPLPVSNESWARRPFTRKEFHALSQITPDMSDAEVERRRRAADVSALRQSD